MFRSWVVTLESQSTGWYAHLENIARAQRTTRLKPEAHQEAFNHLVDGTGPFIVVLPPAPEEVAGSWALPHSPMRGEPWSVPAGKPCFGRRSTKIPDCIPDCIPNRKPPGRNIKPMIAA